MIYYFCSNGERISQATIDKRRSEAYRRAYQNSPRQLCECGQPANGSSHVVSQKHCKELKRTELIWDRRNFYPACAKHNSSWESNDTATPGYNRLMERLKELDPEGYRKRTLLIKN